MTSPYLDLGFNEFIHSIHMATFEIVWKQCENESVANFCLGLHDSKMNFEFTEMNFHTNDISSNMLKYRFHHLYVKCKRNYNNNGIK